MARQGKEPGPSPALRTPSTSLAIQASILDVVPNRICSILLTFENILGKSREMTNKYRKTESVQKGTDAAFQLVYYPSLRWRYIHFRLGRNHMKILAAVLLFGVVLMTALPVAADGIFHPGVENKFFGISLNDKFDGNINGDVWDSRSFLVANAFLSDLSDDKFHHDGLMDWDFVKHGSSLLPDWKGWSVEDHGHSWNSGGKKEDLGAAIVAEPGSFSLLLFGLAIVGFLGPRRMGRARTI
jgi:hypothetical protein